ncbi:MAG: carbohydrate ABC transporter permease [Nocardioidaceae bacterium]
MSTPPRAYRPLTLGRVLVVAALVVIAAVFFLPLLWMLASSFKSNHDIFASPFRLPRHVDLAKWGQAWRDGELGHYVLNSVIVSGVSVLAVLVLSSMAAFAFARFRFPGRSLLMAVLGLGLLLPVQSYFIAQSHMFTDLALTDTRWALIIPYTAMGLPLATYLLTAYLSEIPDEIFEAAMLEGAGEVRLLLSITVPLLRPGLAAVGVFTLLSTWNEFLLALLYISDDSLKTIPTGLLAFSSKYITDYSMLFAALSIITLPLVVIYVVFNRQIDDSVAAGSLK